MATRCCIKCRSWLYRKRHNLLVAVIGSVLCLLFLKRSKFVENMEVETISYDNADPQGSQDKAISIIFTNDTYGRRRSHVVNECRKKNLFLWKIQSNGVPKFKDSPIISTKHNLMYCPVGKVASSFFTRYVLAMERPGMMMSPYDIPIEQAGRGRCESFKTLGSEENIIHFLNKSTNVVFGRNPFSRIFSAYIDKLFSPNPFYWKYWGERALKLDKTMKVGKPCASDVSFPQFLQLVLFDLHSSDVHLRQVYDECHMCHLNYDVIGQLETTTEDLDYLSKKLNISSQFQHEEKYKFAAKMDVVYDSVKSAFSWKKDIARCISLDEMGLRIWRKLQIRGVFDSGISYPFKLGEINSMRTERFISACKDAILASTDKAQLKKQKNQALLEAYSFVSIQHLKGILDVYKDDFAMFDYNPKPAKIFGDRSQIQRTGFLNWRTDWKV